MNRMVINAVLCDLKIADDCTEEYEPLPGLTVYEARRDAASFGWGRYKSTISTKLGDACGPCLARLKELDR